MLLAAGLRRCGSEAARLRSSRCLAPARCYSASGVVRLSERPSQFPGRSFTVTMDSRPANTFTTSFLAEFTEALDQLTLTRDVRSVVIESALPKIFSSGFDLKQLSGATSREQLREFLQQFRIAFHSLHSAPFYTVARIQGHAPAGGCALALACDYRVMLDDDKLKIGLTPTKVGITPPLWLLQLAQSRFRSAHACERALLAARLFSPKEALCEQLVDSLAANSAEAEAKIDEQLRAVHGADWTAANHVRAIFQHPVLALMEADAGAEQFISSVMSDECQQLLASAGAARR